MSGPWRLGGNTRPDNGDPIVYAMQADATAANAVDFPLHHPIMAAIVIA